jgi:hypothetical protein
MSIQSSIQQGNEHGVINQVIKAQQLHADTRRKQCSNIARTHISSIAWRHQPGSPGPAAAATQQDAAMWQDEKHEQHCSIVINVRSKEDFARFILDQQKVQESLAN